MMIETERLIVRPFREEDADALYRIKTDPQVTECCPDFLDVDAKTGRYARLYSCFQED